MIDFDLEQCPFCGEYPILYCDCTNWKGDIDFETAKKYPSYHLIVNHKDGCYFRYINGTNRNSEASASYWKILVDSWNRRNK